ncbi:hypothetical protein [Micromonospora sp. NPDC005413]|uniref:hypothetical protein n=1 Tax=Micromonospora sp. NPDC005413 TaxID=3154563 RepID=UPI0033B931CD
MDLKGRVDVAIIAAGIGSVVPPRLSVLDGRAGMQVVEFRALNRRGFVRRDIAVPLALTPDQARRAKRSFWAVTIANFAAAPVSVLALLTSLVLLVLARMVEQDVEPSYRRASEVLLAVGFAALASMYVIRKVAVLPQYPRVTSDGHIVLREVCREAAEDLVALNGDDVARILQ